VRILQKANCGVDRVIEKKALVQDEMNKYLKTNKMKTLKLLVFGILLMFAGSAHSQVSINVHIGTPPAWGPAGYDNVRYYYLPDIEAYYDVPSAMFIYLSGNRWVHRHQLPPRYRNYDLYGGYKVVMNDYRPYDHFREHRIRYARGYRGDYQRNMGERHGYEQNYNNGNGRPKGWYKHNEEREENRGEGRGNGHGHGHGNGRGEDHGRGRGNRD